MLFFSVINHSDNGQFATGITGTSTVDAIDGTGHWDVGRRIVDGCPCIVHGRAYSDEVCGGVIDVMCYFFYVARRIWGQYQRLALNSRFYLILNNARGSQRALYSTPLSLWAQASVFTVYCPP